MIHPLRSLVRGAMRTALDASAACCRGPYSPLRFTFFARRLTSSRILKAFRSNTRDIYVLRSEAGTIRARKLHNCRCANTRTQTVLFTGAGIPFSTAYNEEREISMKRILPRAAIGNPATRSYVRQPMTTDDLRLSPETRQLLQSLDKLVLPIHLASRFPRVLNEIARLWRRPAHLDRYFDDLLIDKRGGRQGFPFAVAAELAALKDYYQTEVYPKRQCVWQNVYSVPSYPQK